MRVQPYMTIGLDLQLIQIHIYCDMPLNVKGT